MESVRAFGIFDRKYATEHDLYKYETRLLKLHLLL